jgi:phytoene synthase
MLPKQYCLSKVKNHPWRHWVKIYVHNSDQQQAVLSLLAFEQELNSIQTIENIEVAQQKLQWWVEELNLFLSKKPRHPVFISLKECMKIIWPKQYFEDMIEASWYNLTQIEFSESQLKTYCNKTMGSLFVLICNALGTDDPILHKNAHSQGASIREIQIIQNLGHDVRNNNIFLPNNLLESYNITKEELESLKPSQRLNQALESYANSSDKRSLQQPSCSFLNILCDYYLELLKQIKKEKFEVLNTKIILSPLHTHWTFYKSLKKHKRKLNNYRQAATL